MEWWRIWYNVIIILIDGLLWGRWTLLGGTWDVRRNHELSFSQWFGEQWAHNYHMESWWTDPEPWKSRLVCMCHSCRDRWDHHIIYGLSGYSFMRVFCYEWNWVAAAHIRSCWNLPDQRKPQLPEQRKPLKEAKSWPWSDFELFFVCVRVSFLFV